MDPLNVYLAIRCFLLADDLDRLDDIHPADRAAVLAQAGRLLEAVAEALLMDLPELEGRRPAFDEPS